MKVRTPAKKPSRDASVRKVSPVETNRRTSNIGLTAKIRKHLGKIDGPFAACIVARELGVPAGLFYHFILPMRRRGEIEKAERGWYRYKKKALYQQSPEIWPRLFRAMHVKIRFSVREIALLADIHPHVARYLANRLAEAKEIEIIGTQRTPHKKIEWVYRVKNADEFFLKHVRGGSPASPEKSLRDHTARKVSPVVQAARGK